MSTQTTLKDTSIVPAVSLEEVQVLSFAERATLTNELKAAEARIDAGEFISYDREDQRRRFKETYARGL